MKSERLQENNLPEYVDGLPIAEIFRAVKSIRYGDIRIIVQNAEVVQIDKTEKTRLPHNVESER